MNLDIAFEPSPWELTLETLKDSVPAMRLLTLLEGEPEDCLEDAFRDLEDRKIRLDTEDLPKQAFDGEAALRLRREEQLVREGKLMEQLEPGDPLRIYLEELASTPACGDPEALAERAAAGEEDARNMLVTLSLSSVISAAEKMTGRGVLLLDLIQEGSLGLWQSILNWDGRGSFESHRDWWIHQSMAKLITVQARANGVGQKMRQAMEDYRSVEDRLLAELGRNPTLEEIALQIHMTPEQASEVAEMIRSAWMMNKVSTAEKPEEAPEEEDQAVEDTAYFQMRQRIQELLSGLEDADAKLLTMRFGLEGGLPLSPEETGRKLGLTSEEVVEKETKILMKLRKQG